MRFIYKILIGLLIFNSMLVFLSGFFTIQGVEPPESSGAINISGEGEVEEGVTYTEKFSITGEVFKMGTLDILVLGVPAAIGLLVSIGLKSPVPLGAALFSGFLMLLYVKSATVINNVAPQGNWIISGIIGLIGICIGILAAFTIIEYFAGQTGAD